MREVRKMSNEEVNDLVLHLLGGSDVHGSVLEILGTGGTWYDALVHFRRNAADTPADEHTTDPINPNHYKTETGVECIEVAELFPYCLGNAIKYAWRAGKKGDLKQDLKKCEWYLNRALENGEDSMFKCNTKEVLRAKRLFGKLSLVDLDRVNHDIVNYIVNGGLDYAISLIGEQLTKE